MDPDGTWTSTRAVLLAAAGQNRWPPAGNYMATDAGQLPAHIFAVSRRLWCAEPYVANMASTNSPRGHIEAEPEAPMTGTTPTRNPHRNANSS